MKPRLSMKTATIAVVVVAACTCVFLFGTIETNAQTADCASVRFGNQIETSAAHAYFSTLVARPDCMLAYSLRSQDELVRFKHSKKNLPAVTYDLKGDPDPRRQDAAKIVIPADKVSLPNQVRLPMSTSDGTTTLVTWDAWFGAEFRYSRAGIGHYKTFQFASPKDRIWFEVRTRFGQSASRGGGGGRRRKRAAAANNISLSGAGGIGMVDARGYGARGTAPFGPNVTNNLPLSPQKGTFEIQPETWTRYWVLLEQRADDWDLVSLWVADENHDPAQLLDRLQLTVNGSVDSFWLEYNTSLDGSRRPKDRGPLVGYARNVVVLRNVRDVANLLVRPIKSNAR